MAAGQSGGRHRPSSAYTFLPYVPPKGWRCRPPTRPITSRTTAWSSSSASKEISSRPTDPRGQDGRYSRAAAATRRLRKTRDTRTSTLLAKAIATHIEDMKT